MQSGLPDENENLPIKRGAIRLPQNGLKQVGHQPPNRIAGTNERPSSLLSDHPGMEADVFISKLRDNLPAANVFEEAPIGKGGQHVFFQPFRDVEISAPIHLSQRPVQLVGGRTAGKTEDRQSAGSTQALPNDFLPRFRRNMFEDIRSENGIERFICKGKIRCRGNHGSHRRQRRQRK